VNSTVGWIALYVVQAIWWLWLARGGGARFLDSYGMGWLVAPVPPWNIEVIKLIAWLSLTGTTVLFVLGLADPAIRSLFP
jgi:hypothetical protein